MNEYEWGNEHENFLKFSGAVETKQDVLDVSGASRLYITGVKGVFFSECVDTDGAFGLVMQLVSMPVNKMFQSSLGTSTFKGFK